MVFLLPHKLWAYLMAHNEGCLKSTKRKAGKSTAYIDKTKNSSLLWNYILNIVSGLHDCDYLNEKRIICVREENVSPILKNNTYYTFESFPQVPSFSLTDLT